MISAEAGAHLREKNYPQLRKRPLTSAPTNPLRRVENYNSGNKNRRHEAATLKVGPKPSHSSSAAKASLSRASESPCGSLTLSHYKGAIVTEHPRKPLRHKTNSDSKGIGSGALLTPLPQITSDEHPASIADTIHCNSEKAHGLADKQVSDWECEMRASQEIEAILMKVVKELSVAREISYCSNTSVDVLIGALGIDDHGRHVSCSGEENKPCLRMYSNDNDHPIHSLEKDVIDKRATTPECPKAANDAKIKHRGLLDDDESLGSCLFMGDGGKNIYKLSKVEVSEILSEATNVSADDNELKPNFCGKANDEKCCPESTYTVSSLNSSAHLSIATCHGKKISNSEERFPSEISSKTPKSGNRSRKGKLMAHPTRNVSSIRRANSSAPNIIRTQAATRTHQQKERSREKKADKMLKNPFGMKNNEELKKSLKVNHENLSAISQKTARSKCCTTADDEERINKKNITESVPRDAKNIPISDLKKCGDNQVGENDTTTLNLNSKFIETKNNPILKDILQIPPKETNLLTCTSQSKLISENCIEHMDETLHPVTADIPDDNLPVMKESSVPSAGEISGDSIDCNGFIVSFPECHDSGRAGSPKLSRDADVMPVMLPGCRRRVGLSETISPNYTDADVMRSSRGVERSEEESSTAFEPKERGTFILSFSNIPSHGLPVIKRKSRFEEQFKLFAKFKNFRNTGVIISRLNSCRWLKQAKVTDHRFTVFEAGILFRKIAMTKLALNIHDFESYLVLVAETKKTDWKVIKRQLTTCGIPRSMKDICY